MYQHLPPKTEILLQWGWSDLEGYYQDLQNRPLDSTSVDEWLSDWSRISECFDELYSRLYLARLSADNGS
jgi:hypothetical protein